LKKLRSDATALLQLIERWSGEAVVAGRPINRIALAYEAVYFMPSFETRPGHSRSRQSRACS
jgi:hypothetical protein